MLVSHCGDLLLPCQTGLLKNIKHHTQQQPTTGEDPRIHGFYITHILCKPLTEPIRGSSHVFECSLKVFDFKPANGMSPVCHFHPHPPTPGTAERSTRIHFCSPSGAETWRRSRGGSEIALLDKADMQRHAGHGFDSEVHLSSGLL